MADRTLPELAQRVLRHRDERDWAQFHTPKELAVSLVVESAELLALMQWKSGEMVVLWYTAGVRTKAGRSVEVFDTIHDAETARAAAEGIADAFGPAGGRPAIEVRAGGTPGDDPAETRRAWIWVGIVVAAFAAGFAWELADRW